MSEKSVDAELVNRFQRSGRWHEFTCRTCRGRGDRWTGPMPEHQFILEVEDTEHGVVLVCPEFPEHRQVLSDHLAGVVARAMSMPADAFLFTPDKGPSSPTRGGS